MSENKLKSSNPSAFSGKSSLIQSGFYLPIENEVGFKFEKIFGSIPRLEIGSTSRIINKSKDFIVNGVKLYQKLLSIGWKEFYVDYSILDMEVCRVVLIFENEQNEHFLFEFPVREVVQTYQIDFLSDAKDSKNYLKFLELIQECSEKINFTNCEIDLILSKNGELFTQSYEIPQPTLDIGLNYGQSFIEKDLFLQEKLNKEKKGLVLLHGHPGTGKTFYIKYLLSKISRKIIYLPSHMVSILADPTFLTLMQENSDSVLIIEDGEKALIPRTVGFDSSVANILNLTDGFLSDALKILVVITFNTSKKNIDEALLRKGRLMFEHEFTKLEPEDAMRLYEHLYKKQILFKEPTSLAEIYNLEENYTTDASKKKIGYNS